MTLKNAVILITGSAVRVGKEIALNLAEAGARVIVHFRKKQREAESTAGEIARITGEQPLVLQGDIAHAAVWRRMRDAILNTYGRIDVLINNAADFYKTPLLSITEEQWEHLMTVNLKSVFLGCQIIGECMLRQKSGKIINIADVAGYTVWPDYIPYCVSKAGVIALTKGMAKAMAPHVLVNAIAPGTVLLAENHDPEEEKRLIERTPLKRIGSPDDIAKTAAFLIENGDFLTGQVIRVDGGRSL